MRIIDNGDHLYAVGLEWEVSPFGPLKPREVRAHARRLRATHCVEYQGTEGDLHVSYGYCRLPAMPRDDARQPVSLACAVATTSTDAAMFVMPLAGGEAAFVGVLSGQPAPGCDLVGPEATIAAAVARFAETNSVLQVSYAPAFGRPDFLQGYGLRPVHWEAETATHQVRRLRGIPALAIVAGVGLVATAGLVGAAHYIHDQQERAWAQQQSRGPDPVAVYRQSRDAAFQEFSPVPAAGGASVLLADLMHMPVLNGGWQAGRIQCRHLRHVVPATFECSARWSGPSGSFRSFQVPAGATVDYADDLAGITHRWQVPLARTRVWDLAQVDRLPGVPGWKVGTGSVLQDLAAIPGTRASLTAAVQVGATTDPAVKERLLRGTWSLQGPADLISELVDGLPAHLTLETIELTLPEATAASKAEALPQVNIQGGYLVRQTL